MERILPDPDGQIMAIDDVGLLGAVRDECEVPAASVKPWQAPLTVPRAGAIKTVLHTEFRSTYRTRTTPAAVVEMKPAGGDMLRKVRGQTGWMR
ncbi:MAG: hypothetical protein ACSLE9_08295 [Burkholderiaceae bacterium]